MFFLSFEVRLRRHFASADRRSTEARTTAKATARADVEPTCYILDVLAVSLCSSGREGAITGSAPNWRERSCGMLPMQLQCSGDSVEKGRRERQCAAPVPALRTHCTRCDCELTHCAVLSQPPRNLVPSIASPSRSLRLSLSAMSPSWVRVDGRHGAWMHPLATMLLLFTAIIGVTILVHDLIVTASPHFGTAQGDMFEKGAPPTNFQPWVAYLFAVYIVVMILSRYLDCGSYIFYESVWCCNSSLIMAAIGILTDRPLLIGASVAGVCCDQSLWYLDCACYLLTGKFKIGVAKYLLWPETSWSKRYLCTHHLYVDGTAMRTASESNCATSSI